MAAGNTKIALAATDTRRVAPAPPTRRLDGTPSACHAPSPSPPSVEGTLVRRVVPRAGRAVEGLGKLAKLGEGALDAVPLGRVHVIAQVVGQLLHVEALAPNLCRAKERELKVGKERVAAGM